MVKGLENRKAATGKTPIMIHVRPSPIQSRDHSTKNRLQSSGTGALTDDAKGEFAAEKVYVPLPSSLSLNNLMSPCLFKL